MYLKEIVITGVVVSMLAIVAVLAVYVSVQNRKEEIQTPSMYNPNPPIVKLMDAIIMVESTGQDDAIGGAKEIGCMQITLDALLDINRILGETRYYPHDRFSREKSKEMFVIYTDYYLMVAMTRHDADYTTENMARIWHCGPVGWRNEKTIKYWNKVRKALEDM